MESKTSFQRDIRFGFADNIDRFGKICCQVNFDKSSKQREIKIYPWKFKL